MRIHHSGTAVLAAAAVLLSASTSPNAGPASASSSRTAGDAPVVVSTAGPAPYSFDDLTPTQASSAVAPTASSTRAVAGRPRPPHPPRTGAHGSWPAAGTPQAVLAAAYRSAVAKAPTGCHLRVEHLAAIGQVESGSIGGRSVTSTHQVSPAIYGPLLDGGPFAVVTDSDGGSYDGDSQYDRAMGPLQFLPGTWSWAGRDGDGDGRRDPQNVFDAALATAGYLCVDGRDLSSAGGLRSAVLSYNQSDDYHSAVVEWVSYFREHGLAALTDVAFRVGSGGRASDLPEPETDEQKASPTTDTATAGTTSAPPKKPPHGTPSASPTAAPTQAPTPTPRPRDTVAVPPTTTTTTPTTTPPSTTPTTPPPTTTTPPPATTTPPDPEPTPGG